MFKTEIWLEKQKMEKAKISEKKEGKITDYISKVKGLFGLNEHVRMVRLVKGEARLQDFTGFLKTVEKFDSKFDVDEVRFVADELDEKGFREILKSFSKKNLIKIEKTEEKISPAEMKTNEIREVVHEEMKKPSVVREAVKTIKQNDKFEDVCKFLKNFKLEHNKIRDERELEGRIFDALKNSDSFKKFNIEEQKKYDKGRLDIAIDKKIAIELKLLTKATEKPLQDLQGQLTKYANDYKYICVVLVNKARVSDTALERWKEEYLELAERKAVEMKIIVL